MCSILLFDLGNVIVDLDIPATEQALYKLLGANREHFERFARQEDWFERFETGVIDEHTFIRGIREFCPDQPSQEVVIQAWNAMLLDVPVERLEWLVQLKEHQTIALLSNTNSLHIRWVEEFLARTHDWDGFADRCFHRVYYSHDIGYRKPELTCFKYVLDDLGVDPEEVLFIDDLSENTRAAEELGIKAVTHDPRREIREMLEIYRKAVT